MAEAYHAIIVGGGHNGLVTAAYLAGAGRRVLVLESRELVGGCAVTEEIWPGYRVSTASYLASLMQEKVVRELELEKFGYKVDAKDPAFFSPFPDGRYMFMWQDRAKTLAEIAKFSTKDAEAYPKYEAYLEKLAIVVESLLLVTPPEFPPGPGDFLDYLRLLGKLRGLSKAEIVGMVKIFKQSAAELLDEWFESEQLKVTLATDGVIGANGGPRSPGTAYILMHHCMGGVTGHRGLWGFVRGGMGGVSNAIADSAKARGAEIRTNAPVSKILVNNHGRATGVQLESGEEIRGNIIASNLDPKRTFLKLLDEQTLPAEFVTGIRRFRVEGTSLKMNLALRGVPSFTALPGPGPQHGATMHICPSVEYIEHAWDDAKYGRPSRSPLIEMTMPTMYDKSLAPEGHHIMGIFLQYAPYTLKGTTWEAEREPYSQRILDCIEEYCPNIRDIVVNYQTLSPWDLEQRFGIAGGNIFHGEMSVDQMFVMRPLAGYADYRTPIRGLYLCGSGAHPGGGVMGAPGHNCAREILKDT